MNKSSQDKNAQDVGANLFIGNLDPDVDEKVGGGFRAPFWKEKRHFCCS